MVRAWLSTFLGRVRNTLRPNPPVNRVSARAGGVFICLFVLVTVSGAFRGFHRDILVALSVSPVVLPIFLWILGRYSSLQRVNRRYLTGEGEEPHWELRMSIAFSLLLGIIVAAAFLLAMRDIYPK